MTMPDFYVTFGQKYPRVPHPRWGPAHHDGWVRLVGVADRAEAIEWCTALFGQAWSEVYDRFIGFTGLFPLGEIGRVDVTGHITPGDPHAPRPDIEDAREYIGAPARRLAAAIVYYREIAGSSEESFQSFYDAYGEYLAVDPAFAFNHRRSQ